TAQSTLTPQRNNSPTSRSPPRKQQHSLGSPPALPCSPTQQETPALVWTSTRSAQPPKLFANAALTSKLKAPFSTTPQLTPQLLPPNCLTLRSLGVQPCSSSPTSTLGTTRTKQSNAQPVLWLSAQFFRG